MSIAGEEVATAGGSGVGGRTVWEPKPVCPAGTGGY